MGIGVVILRAIVLSFEIIFCKIKRILVWIHHNLINSSCISGHFSYNSIFADKTSATTIIFVNEVLYFLLFPRSVRNGPLVPGIDTNSLPAFQDAEANYTATNISAEHPLSQLRSHVQWKFSFYIY